MPVVHTWGYKEPKGIIVFSGKTRKLGPSRELSRKAWNYSKFNKKLRGTSEH
jgi:hypothetical protein